MNLLEILGYDDSYYSFLDKKNGMVPARVANQSKDRYLVFTSDGTLPAEVTGNLRFSANSITDFPVVGDWVEVSVFEEMALIHKILPRKSILSRKAVDKHGEKQPIATNVDYALVVQSVDRDFNLNRLERYVAMAFAEGIEPLVVLNKADLVKQDDLTEKSKMIRDRLPNIEIVKASIFQDETILRLKNHFQRGKTYCFLGSSGVGKSSLINALLSQELQKTKDISASSGKGRHTTSHREMFILENGAVVIDNPGMREVGLADTEMGLENTFEAVAALAKKCRFADCSHTKEPDCAVMHAVKTGQLDESSLINYQKLVRETEHYALSVVEKKHKDKRFGKMCNQIMREIKKRKG